MFFLSRPTFFMLLVSLSMSVPELASADEPIRLSPSTAPLWSVGALPRPEAEGSPDAFVRARNHNAPIFQSRDFRFGRGVARVGSVIPAQQVAGNQHCRRWYALEPEGYVCGTRGFTAFDEAPAHTMLANVAAPMPYQYAQVTNREAFRFRELPTARQMESLSSGRTLPDLAQRLDGDYFVAVAEEVEHEGETWVRTVADKYVRRSALTLVTASTLSGEYNPNGLTLPMGFVYQDDVLGTGPNGQEVSAPRYSRFQIAERHEDHLMLDGGIRLPREGVRVVRLRVRPRSVRDDERWIHVNLGQQTITAYEGDTPVFVSLVASGKPGYETPVGSFRVRHKYISTTMRGDDPIDGVYDVAEVPWTQYYQGSYALHGAYWHDAFGAVRSHGCTNIAPRDARFLFAWSMPQVPEGWYGARQLGTFVLITRE